MSREAFLEVTCSECDSNEQIDLTQQDGNPHVWTEDGIEEELIERGWQVKDDKDICANCATAEDESDDADDETEEDEDGDKEEGEGEDNE